MENLERGQQIFLLTLFHEGFKNDVQKIRKKWGIPQIGFLNGDQHLKWTIKLRSKSDEYVKNTGKQDSNVPNKLFYADL